MLTPVKYYPRNTVIPVLSDPILNRESESASVCGPKACPWCFTRSLQGRSQQRPFLQKMTTKTKIRPFFVLVTNPVHQSLNSVLRARLTRHHHPPNFGAGGTISLSPLCPIMVCVGCCYPLVSVVCTLTLLICLVP